MLEICVDSWQSVEAAIKGGANRLELCSALIDGGLTPTVGFLRSIKLKYPKIPVFVMLRPHGGNDFTYTETEIDIICSDMKDFHLSGADGFVFGSLHSNHTINEEQCKLIVKEAKELPVTFHRAFDLTDSNDLLVNLQKLEEIGCKRLLTSGLMSTAERGIVNIKTLNEHKRSIIIVPGCGINVGNCEKILQFTGCKEFHASASKNFEYDKDVVLSMMDSEVNFGTRKVTDCDVVRQLVEIGKNVIFQ